MFKKLKKQNGETFARTIRDYHNGLLEIPDIDIILRHAGRNAWPLLPYLMSFLSSNDDTIAPVSLDPFDLLDQAGYTAFHADDLKKQNSIKGYFKSSELLCTFNDNARYKNYHIIHAIKKDVDKILREDFYGKEERQDEYGTSVISIQMRKKGGFISIKNRYNHTVMGCDNTFNSNPDNIIEGLSESLKEYFNVDFSATKSPLPEGFVLIGDQVFKYHAEVTNIYYGDQAWAENGTIHEVDKSAGDALLGRFLFDNKNKILKNIDNRYPDHFVDDFNQCYGGNRALTFKKGNLLLDDEILIGTEESRIKTIHLPALTTMSNNSLCRASSLTHFKAPALTSMGNGCLADVPILKNFDVPALETMGNTCLSYAPALKNFDVPALETMGNTCLSYAPALKNFQAPALSTMGNGCFRNVIVLTHFEAPKLRTMGNQCLTHTDVLTHFNAPALNTMGDICLANILALKHFEAPALEEMGNSCLADAPELKHFKVPVLKTMGDSCLANAPALKHFESPVLKTMEFQCLYNSRALMYFEAPLLNPISYYLKPLIPSRNCTGIKKCVRR